MFFILNYRLIVGGSHEVLVKKLLWLLYLITIGMFAFLLVNKNNSRMIE